MLTRYRNSVRTKWRYRFVTLMQEVCGSWAGRKRLVAVGSGEGLWVWIGLCWGSGDWETGDGDKWGHDDVVGDGGDAGSAAP